jgi:hypothetical protein
MPEKTNTVTTGSSKTDPWSQQSPYLTQAFSNASNIYNQGAGNLYNGQQIAQFTPDQLNTFNSMVGYGNNMAVPNSSAAAGGALTSAGTGGVTHALNELANFKPTGGTQSNIDAAGQYANNPYISGQVDAAMRDVNRNATENILPSIARNANAGGNINSNRTAIQQGIVERGVNDQAGDISSALRGQAYSQGLNLAEQNSEATNNANLNAMTAGGALGNAAAGTGVNANTGSVNQAGSLFNMANVGGAGQQTAGQASIDNNKAMSEYAANRQNALLQAMYGVVGSNNWGGTTNSTQTTDTTKTASPLTLAGSALGAVGSALIPGTGGISAAGNLYSLFKGTGLA